MNEVTRRVFISQDWLTIVIILTIGLIALNKLWKPERFSKIKTLLYNDFYINDFSKATILVTNIFTYLFVVINSVIISLLLFIIIDKVFKKQSDFGDFQLFSIILSSVFGYIIVRAIVGYLLGSLFEFEKEQQYISFLKISYLNNFSILILPLLIISFYTNSTLFSYFSIAISILLLLFYFIKIIKLNQKLIFGSFFYFILYLCALEIAPILLFYKVFIS